MALGHGAVRVEHRGVFIGVAGSGRHGAGSDPDVFWPQPRQPRHHRRVRRRRAGVEVVFEIAGGAHRGRPRAEREIPLAHLVALDQNSVGRRQHRAEQPGQPLVAREGAVGNTRVDDGQRGAGPLRFPKEVGPDLGFRGDHQRRVQPPQHAAHGKYVIHGRIENTIGQFPQLVLRGGLPGDGSRGNEQLGSWELGAHAAEEIERTQNFAHRNRVQPDRPRTGLI